MIVPLSTDAPIYYYPRGTIGLIVVNVLAFLLTKGGAEEYIAAYGLSHGDGLHPWQWLTSNFIHYGYVHLVGNMVFLWGFGLVIEGKIGPLLYVPIYLGIGAVQCAIEQALFTHDEFSSFGASAILFGLMAMSLIWAPVNEVTVFYWILFRIGFFDMPIIWYSVLSLMFSMAITILLGAENSSEILHLMGAVIGGSVGFTMLVTKAVDCEGYDILSVMFGKTPQGTRFVQREGALKYGQRKLKRKRQRRDKDSAPALATQVVERATSDERFVRLVEQNKPQAAFVEYKHLQRSLAEWKPKPELLRKLSKGLRKLRQFSESLEVNLEYLKRTDFQDATAILDATDILILIKSQPTAARKLLTRIDASKLTSEQRARMQKIDREAGKAIEEGVLEIEADL